MFRFPLREILQAQNLEELMQAFISSARMGIALVDARGEILSRPRPAPLPPFCRLVRSRTEGRKRCALSYRKAARTAALMWEPYLFRCHGGLLSWAVPVRLDGEAWLTLVCGQALMLDGAGREEDLLAELAAATGLPLPALRESFGRLPVVSPRLVQAAVEVLFVVANYLNRTRALPVAAPAGAVRPQPVPRRASLLDREQELLTRVRMRDRPGAQAVLATMLEDLLAADDGTSRVRIRAAEWISLISRAAADAAQDPDQVLREADRFVAEALHGDGPGVAALVRAALDHFLPPSAVPRDAALLGPAIHYVLRNYHNPDLRLERVARAAHMSPSHLSHLFRRHLDCSVMSYVNRVRIEEAKRLLRETDLTIKEIATRTGFRHQGYFSRAFSRLVQVSPRVYRYQCRSSPTADELQSDRREQDRAKATAPSCRKS